MTVGEGRTPDRQVVRQLHRLVTGYQVSQAVHVAATLGVCDLLADGPKRAGELAAATGADARSLTRLMRALVAIGVCAGDDEGFANTELGDALRTDAPYSIAGWARYVGRPHHWQAYGALEHSIRTGENGFAVVHGRSVWEYLTEQPEEQAAFDAAMTSLSQAVSNAVVDGYDFGQFGTVVDIGGGRGLLMSAILSRYPSVQGVLFDQPGVVAGAGEMLGVLDRCEVVGGSFFESVPPGGDAYVLKSVIHDWADAESVAILTTCRRAIPEHGRLLLVEQLLDDSPDPVRTACSDLTMLVVAGGQERTTDEYRALLSEAGFDLMRAVPTASNFFILEARPA
ncbi:MULTISPECIES: methyltransferase [unclassified Kribbella]|uniref:methyltransferase n=1 Tax=unclassified Kribbella TaxID=2644121 RepID=UPI0030783E27